MDGKGTAFSRADVTLNKSERDRGAASER